jgi:hypothetical protein
MNHSRRAFALAAILCLTLGCATPSQPQRQWLEGDILHYDNGMGYEDAVSIALPHYHIDGAGRYAPTNEPSATHFHLSLNRNGPAGQYVRCFAKKNADGTWTHSPQWYENDPKWRQRDGGYGR